MSAEQYAGSADHISGIDAPEVSKTLYGHDTVFRRLHNQFVQNRLPGALLLHGPRGIGKATLSFEFARRVVLASGDEAQSRVNEQISLGVHPNVVTLRRVARESGGGFYKQIRVGDVRAVLRKLQQTRGRAGERIVIVDSIDDCNSSAANALLKTLEEPPQKTCMILISHRPDALMATIRSRCQAFAMRPRESDLVAKILTGSGGEISDEKQDTDLDSAIMLAAGRPRRGFEALGMGNIAVLNQLSQWLENPFAGGERVMLGICEALANKKNHLEAEFAREVILDWIASETRGAAAPAGQNPRRLASAIKLWEKANQLFETSDSYNLDHRQAMIILFDEISAHVQLSSSPPA